MTHTVWNHSYLDRENRAKDKIFHAAFEAALISLQCGTHLLRKERVYNFDFSFLADLYI